MCKNMFQKYHTRVIVNMRVSNVLYRHNSFLRNDLKLVKLSPMLNYVHTNTRLWPWMFKLGVDFEFCCFRYVTVMG